MCSDVTVVILDRPRHSDIVKQCRAAGARIRLISDGDVSAAIEVAQQGAPVDVMIGIGGTPEGSDRWATTASWTVHWVHRESTTMKSAGHH